jgi:hypothetical protein
MEANELRIGNLLMYGSRMAVVSAIFKSHFKCESLEQICFGNSIQSNFQPIPLTPEILEKCGFEKRKTRLGAIIYHKGDFVFNEIMHLSWKQGNVIEIKHLHQLQNLYFALTGEELTFKP